MQADIVKIDGKEGYRKEGKQALRDGNRGVEEQGLMLIRSSPKDGTTEGYCNVAKLYQNKAHRDCARMTGISLNYIPRRAAIAS